MDKKIRVLLADTGEEFRMLLQEQLEQTGEFTVIDSTSSGIAAWECIEQDSPDAVILDLVLPELDGMALLRRIRTLSAPPQAIVASAFFSHHIAEDVRATGACAFFTKPVDPQSLAACLHQFVRPAASAADARISALEGQVTAILHELGVPAHLRGYHYLRQAVIYAVNTPEISTAFTKILYPAVGKCFGSTGEQVERSIRTAIEQAWLRGDAEVQRYYCGNTIRAGKGKPTSSELISLLADYLRLQQKRCLI